LNLALPTTDAAFKAEIQKGIEALSEIQNQAKDTLVLDLFVLARSFADYYRSHKDTPAFLQNAALVAAFKSFESGESNEPLAYFNPKLRSLLFTYRHYYPLFNEPVPERINACQIEYIGSAYVRGEAEGPDPEMVYAVTSNWQLAFAKLKTMSITGRDAAIQTIEEALDSDDLSDPPIEAIGRQHIVEAKVFFEKTP